MQSTNIDTTTTTAKPTPAPVRMFERPPLAPVPLSSPNMVRTPGHPRPIRATPAGAQGTPLLSVLKTTPAAARVHTQQQPQKPPYAPTKPSPLVPLPKTPAADRDNIPKSTARGMRTTIEKSTFSRLATDTSDDIMEFEEKPWQRPLSPIQSESPPDQPLAKIAKPGKRAKPSDSISPTGSQGHGRLAKRPVSSIRQRTNAHYCKYVLSMRMPTCRGQGAV